MKEERITLKDIARRKEEAQKELREQKAIVIGLSKELFAPLMPAPQTHKPNKMQRGVNAIVAVYDGVLIGMKVVRVLRGIFRRR